MILLNSAVTLLQFAEVTAHHMSLCVKHPHTLADLQQGSEAAA